ncbi:unnamed protein product [Phytomonas sp. Hart1]|nr:unnamed protein product [Phytomonas sp. Hart1]|eukprot:CCW67648.1 unnamed protein product [Phytomonas sp. isolate Hart1]
MSLRKVAVLGAEGGIGQSLSLLMKTNPYVGELHLYDIRGSLGVAADLSHIPTPCKVYGYAKGEMHTAMAPMDMVLIPAGVPRKPGMTRDDLFGSNASIVQELVQLISTKSPEAIIGVVTNPVNSTLPIAAEVLKRAKVYNPRKLFGVTTLDTVRARTFIGETLHLDPRMINVQVIGGHSGETIIPVLSPFDLTEEQVKKITHRVQFGGDEVVEAKAGAGSATLCMAFAAEEWANAVFRALAGEPNIVISTFIECDTYPTLPFFSTMVELGKDGIERVLPLPKLNKNERDLLEKSIPTLKKNIERGISFVSNKL